VAVQQREEGSDGRVRDDDDDDESVINEPSEMRPSELVHTPQPSWTSMKPRLRQRNQKMRRDSALARTVLRWVRSRRRVWPTTGAVVTAWLALG
jgi:hypothetical protein